MTQEWRKDAACLAWGTSNKAVLDLFYQGDRTEAKQVCATCPVREPCLDWAMGTGEQEGVWGGLTPEERRRLRQSLNRRLTKGWGPNAAFRQAVSNVSNELQGDQHEVLFGRVHEGVPLAQLPAV